MSSFNQFVGGGIPVGGSVIGSSTVFGFNRLTTTANETYQAFPGALHPIVDAVDALFSTKFPWLCATPGTTTATPTNQLAAGDEVVQVGKVSTKYVALRAGATFGALAEGVGCYSSSVDFSSPTIITAANIGGAATSDILTSVMFAGSVAFTSIRVSSAASRISRSTDGTTFTNVATTLPTASAAYLAANADNTLYVAATGSNAVAGNIFTSTDGITWTSRTPTGFTSGSTCNFAFWCPVISAFVYTSTTRAWTSADGWNQTASAAATLPSTIYRAVSSNTASLVLTSSGIYRTTDGVSYTLIQLAGAVWHDGSNFWIATTAGAIFKSTDDGVTFGFITHSEPPSGYAVRGGSYLSADNKLIMGREDASSKFHSVAVVDTPIAATHIGALYWPTTSQILRVR